MTKENLLDLLRSRVVTVTFTKLNGEVRTMPCTLCDTIIPAEFAPKGTGKPKTDDTISVFCTDKQQWRSFKFANIQSVEA